MKSHLWKVVMLLLIATTTSWSQNERYQLRFQLDKVDCSTKKAYVNVQISASVNAFLLGDANLRFGYDPKIITNPTVVKQFNFSNESQSVAAEYAPISLTGSTERQNKGLVSLNITYTGASKGAQPVVQDWTPIATVMFDVRDNAPDRSSNLSWNDESTFPVSGMNEVSLRNTADGSNYELRHVSNGKFESLALESFIKMCPALSSLPTPLGEVFIPEGFSPNGDGINDKFIITNLGELKVSNFQIYNRDGILVYETDNYQNDWDGGSNQGIRLGNNGLPDGTYFYRVRLSDNRVFVKSLTLAR